MQRSSLVSYGILGAFVLVGGVGLVIDHYHRQGQVETRAVATEKVTEATPTYDSLARELVIRDHAVGVLDDSIGQLLRRPRVVVHDTVEVAGRGKFVPLLDFTRLQLQNDTLRLAVTAFRDTVAAYRRIPPHLEAVADTIIKYQRVLVETPAPRRRWGVGCAGGLGVAAALDGSRAAAPVAIACGIAYSL